ncbi:hypothetical protein K470DRAFT_212051 [Piedraia hortae CBS 480.64]|uniref:HMG box domain-containing protein n=1 Tax=Piedraia hortae CBS 480.64 TaxID=1314780 RepID=A0A6A7C6Z3_9PEZI|nr:hypothetical protein K470DRAFT_212051 [Piedraia hortae CBS 480.64]
MTSSVAVHPGLSPEEDYGLDPVAQFNIAVTSTEHYPGFAEDTKGLGIYLQGSHTHYLEDHKYTHQPPTPRSNTADDGVRTRSGRSTRGGRLNSPLSSLSKSPAPPKSRKEKKSVKSNAPKIDQPLSVLTKGMSVPLKDMDAWVNRPVETRRQEVEKRNGYVARPMNSFMLYRSAYAERTKAWCTQNNHQIVSRVAGESWPMEPQEVRDQFSEWARIERANHAAAHPEYKFSPSKPANKKRKSDFFEDEEALSDLDGDPDNEWRGGRSVRQRRSAPRQQETVSINQTFGFDSNPYYTRQSPMYDQSLYNYANASMQSTIAFDAHGMPYNPHTGAYYRQTHFQQAQYTQGLRVPTPASVVNGCISQKEPSIGGYGLPGQQPQISADQVFSLSRTTSPQQQYGHYDHSLSQPQPSYPRSIPYQHLSLPTTEAYTEHQAYLQAASQPRTEIDPSLEAELAPNVHAGEAGTSNNFFNGSVLGDLHNNNDNQDHDDGALEFLQDPSDGALLPPWATNEVV